jgi:G3E family GTPase
MNPLAPIHRAVKSNVPLDAILGRGGFDLDRILDLEPEFLNPAHGEPGHVHDEHCDHDHDHDHDHHHDHDHGGHAHEDQDIKGVALTLDRPVDGTKVTRWLNEVLQAQGPDILRAKGILDVKGEDKRLVFQAVHMILDGELQRPWREDERRYSRMVFIGRNLDEAALRRGFEACAA